MNIIYNLGIQYSIGENKLSKKERVQDNHESAATVSFRSRSPRPPCLWRENSEEEEISDAENEEELLECELKLKLMLLELLLWQLSLKL